MTSLNELEKAQLCEQISMMLKGGISLSDGFDSLASEEENIEYKNKLTEIKDNLNNNISLSSSLEKSNLFDPYMIGMIRVGETSGYLDKVFSELAIYYHRNNETREKIKSALTYPFILICMMLVVIIVLVLKVLPLFESVLNNIGISLSSLSISLMKLGQVLAIVAVIVLVISVFVLLYCFIVIKQKRYSMINLLEKFRLTKKISYNLALAQFAYCLSLLINSGYSDEDSLRMCIELCENDSLKPKIEKLLNDSKDSSIEETITKNPIFDKNYNRLLVVGAKSGHIEEAITSIADNYEKEVDYSINAFLNTIEPILVTIMSIIVGIILLAVMLPLTSIMSSL